VRWRRSALLAIVGTIVTGAASGDPVQAEPSDPLRIVDLRVFGGEETWHSVNDFRLDWNRSAEFPPVSAVHYLVRDAAGHPVGLPAQIPGEVSEIEHIRVPAEPGAYRVEVWLEGPHGETGPPATARLRFDDAAPGAARPLAPGGWIGASSATLVRIEHPRGPLPVSGIRGYAISVDRGAISSPCLAPTRCTVAETDLSGGIGDDTVKLGALPDGLTFVRVVAVSGSGMRSATVESATLRVDATLPEVELQGVPDGWSTDPVRLAASASDAISGMAAAGPGGPYTAIAIDGAPTVAAGDSVTTTVMGEGVHRVAYYARDAAGNVADGEAGAPLPHQALVRIDGTAPRIAFARAQDPAEPERIEATVSDALSGPDPLRGTIAVRPVGTRQRFEPLPTTFSDGRLLAHWDSDRYPEGSYEFRATAFDAAGNSGSGERRLGGARMVLPSPLKQPTEIVSGFGGKLSVWRHCRWDDGARRCHHQTIESLERRPRTRTVPYGRGAAFSGRLIAAAGGGLGGQPVLVTETLAVGSALSRHTTLARTRPDGTFLVHLAPGPSRRVETSFAGTPLLSRSNGPPARLEVPSWVRLWASSTTADVGGAPIMFSGRVGTLGASVPADGLAVELQFRLPGSGWSEFRTVQTDATGRFHYPYAFSDDDSRGVRFQFRAYFSGEAAWPYEPAASHPVAVTAR
jgi:hypothetical protein